METPESMLFLEHETSTGESFQPMSTANFKTKQNKNKKVVTARSEVVGSRLVECF